MIHFMTRDLYLINRHRQQWQDKLDKRRTLQLVCLITLIVGSALILYPIYSSFWK